MEGVVCVYALVFVCVRVVRSRSKMRPAGGGRSGMEGGAGLSGGRSGMEGGAGLSGGRSGMEGRTRGELGVGDTGESSVSLSS